MEISATQAPVEAGTPTFRTLWPYLLLGIAFGIVAVKSEIISWYRIQEMFRFQSFHMYGIIGSALAVAALSLWLLRRFGVRAANGEPIGLTPKEMGTGRRYLFGGTLFGLGWALTGACPGPLFALIGSGVWVMAVALVSAVAGTWLYAVVQHRLPH